MTKSDESAPPPPVTTTGAAARPYPGKAGGLVALLVSAALAIVLGNWLISAAGDSLPAEVAVHWGPDGADGFSSLSSAVTIGSVAIGGITLFFAVLILVMHRSARTPLAAFGGGTAIGLGVLVFGSTWAQRGVTDAADFDLPGEIFLYALVAGVAAGIVIALLLRAPSKITPEGHGQPPATISASTSGSTPTRWTAPVRMTTRSQVILLAIAVLPMLLFVLLDWWLVIFPLLMLGFLLSMARAVLIVDDAGVAVRSLGFITWLRAAATDISGVEIEPVHPVAQFGGYGVRFARDGKRGFITQRGPAVWIKRGSQPDLVITVEQPEEAAAVIAALVPPQASDSSSER